MRPHGPDPGPIQCPKCEHPPFQHLNGLSDHLMTIHGDLSTRARSLVLDRFRWPGKPVPTGRHD